MLFWPSDQPKENKKRASLRALPPVPQTTWVRPDSPPPIDGNATIIGFDVETKDPGLQEDLGPGWGRGHGHIVGVSLAARDRLGNRGKWYFPLRHEIEGHLNLDPARFFPWLKPIMASSVTKVGANITYDIGWLGEEGIEVNGQLEEIQFAEGLIDNEALVALDVLGHKYLKRGKTTDLLKEWCNEAYPHTPKDSWRSDIYRSPPQLAGLYAEDDADLPIDILEYQKLALARNGQDYVYRMECDLIPLMIAMRRAGVPVDRGAAVEALDVLRTSISDGFRELEADFGYQIQSTKNSVVGPILASLGVKMFHTDNGGYSVRAEWLKSLEHPFADKIIQIREWEKMAGTFIEGYILQKSKPVAGTNGLALLYPSFHQMKTEDGRGTKLGRFSSSGPNLQNIPSRTKEGKKIRAQFVKAHGHSNWRKMDFSQIHYRLLAHYAVGPGSDELRARYNADEKTDYHRDVYFQVAPKMKWSTIDEDFIDDKRRLIKNVNFSGLYGVSLKTLLYKYLIGMSEAEGKEFLKNYHEGAPYVKATMEHIAQEVHTYGYVTTLLGRRVHFNEWEPAVKMWGQPRVDPLPYGMAIREWGAAIKRAYDYRGVNYKFQGGEPDVMKHGLRACWQSGVFNVTGVPRITVHDELGFSQIDESPEQEEAYAFIKRTLETSIKLRVPIFVDDKKGANWGAIK